MNQPRLVPLRPRGERVDRDAVDHLVRHLRGRGRVRRRQLREELGWSDDFLRAVARDSRGEVIGSSSHGYGLTRELSTEAVHRVIAEWRSRSHELNARIAEVIQVLNNRPRDVQPRLDNLGGVA